MRAPRIAPASIGAITLAVVLAACGGAPSTTNAPGGAGASGPSTGGAATQQPGGPATAGPGGAGTGVPAGPPSVNEPCTLLTAAEIKQVTGFEIKWIFPNTDSGDLPVGCNWSLGTAELGADIVIGVRPTGGSSLLDPARGEALEGIGDRALQSEPAVVEALKGDTYVSLTYMEDEERPDVTRELARLIMEKL